MVCHKISDTVTAPSGDGTQIVATVSDGGLLVKANHIHSWTSVQENSYDEFWQWRNFISCTNIENVKIVDGFADLGTRLGKITLRPKSIYCSNFKSHSASWLWLPFDSNLIRHHPTLPARRRARCRSFWVIWPHLRMRLKRHILRVFVLAVIRLVRARGVAGMWSLLALVTQTSSAISLRVRRRPRDVLGLWLLTLQGLVAVSISSR